LRRPSKSRLPLAILAIAILAGASILAAAQGWLKSSCTLETNYFCIKVRDDTRNGQPVRVLILDRLVHSYSSLEDPTRLVYGYEQVYAEATAYQAMRSDPLRALFIGGGGYTFPRYMEAIYPDSKLDVIEIDPGVTEVAYDLLGLRRDTRITTYNEDARMFLAKQPDTQYDLIMGDAFNDFSVPYHLTTQEFNERTKAWLSDGGLYMVNLIDGPVTTSCGLTSTPSVVPSRTSTSYRPCAPGATRRGLHSFSSRPTYRWISPPSRRSMPATARPSWPIRSWIR